MARAKRDRVRAVADPSADALPVFTSIVASQSLPSLPTFIQLGQELCATRLDHFAYRAIRDPGPDPGRLTHQLLYYTALHAQTPPKVDQDAIQREIGSIGAAHLWLHVRDELRVVLAKSRTRLSELETAAADALPDTPKKPRKRRKTGPRNLASLVRFKKAIDKGEREGLSMNVAALQFTHGNKKEAQSLLRQARRHRKFLE